MFYECMIEIVRDFFSLVNRCNINGFIYLLGIFLLKNGFVVILLERLINFNIEKILICVNFGSVGEKWNIVYYRFVIKKLVVFWVLFMWIID